jgi:hypothetical protein
MIPNDPIVQPPKHRVVKISSWREFREIAEDQSFRSWGFRGQASADWPLYSSLSRYLIYTARLNREAWAGQEERILRIFRRKAHLFLQHVPPENESFEWLAIMQHHGAPTRLLDVTWSPYVALFFAIERGREQAAVWGFNAAEINEKEHQTIRGNQQVNLRETGTWIKGSYERDFLHGNKPFAIIGEPEIMNRRLIAQSGTFIVPGVLDEPIESIFSDYPNPEKVLTKFVLLTKEMRKDSMFALYNMNLTHATLFPDLDGLARSMAYELESHWAFDPETMRPYPGYPPPDQVWYWQKRKLEPAREDSK